MDHPENIKTGFEEYFVPHIDFREELENFGIKSAVKVISRSVVNRQAATLMERLITDQRPDIAHLNNIHHQLTPSILYPLKRHNIPVVWTLHDYILTCPDHTHLRRGSICSKCAGGNNIHAVVHRCKKGSLGASLLAAIECSYHSREKLIDMVAKFVCPSRFMADFLLEHGFPREKVINVPNFFPIERFESTGQDYFLYLGRLSAEKGLDTLLEAFSKVGRGRLIIAGDGPDRGKLENLAAPIRSGRVEFIGQQTSESVIRLLRGCLALVLPSTCLENLPYSIMEAMSAGKPVIGSRIGGIPELIDHERNGLLFEPGNSDQLADCLKRLMSDSESARRMGKAGREKTLRLYSAEKHYEAIMDLYSEILGKKSSEKPIPVHN